MKKLKITKEFIKANADKKFKEVFPEICAVLEVGKWYKNEVALVCIEEVLKKNEVKGYGFSSRNQFWESTKWFDRGEWTEATNEEVFEVLKNEAVKRGFVDGVFYKDSTSKQSEFAVGEIKYRNGDLFFDNSSFTIFRYGKWAEIIPTITLQEAEAILNKKII